MERGIHILILIHAVFGGIALLAGLVSMVVKKGNWLHKRSGLFFYYSMLISTVTAMFVALLPNHKSPFLLAVGIFSLYFVLTGRRALRFKRKNPKLRTDIWISRTMIAVGVLMIFLPVLFLKNLNIVLSVFAVVGIVFSARDLTLFKNPDALKENWLKLHLGKMLGAYISATTAFIVVNELLPSFYGWFVPGIVGGLLIAYWIRKLNGKSAVVKNRLN